MFLMDHNGGIRICVYVQKSQCDAGFRQEAGRKPDLFHV